MMGVVTTPTSNKHGFPVPRDHHYPVWTLCQPRRNALVEFTGSICNVLCTCNHWGVFQEAGLWYPPLGKGQVDDIVSECTFREGITLTVSLITFIN